MRRQHFLRTLAVTSAILLSFISCSCGQNNAGTKFVQIGGGPQQGAFFSVSSGLAKVLNDHKNDPAWKATATGTQGSQENIRLLNQGKLDMAISNAAITYFAVKGQGKFDGEQKVKALMTLAPNAGAFVTTNPDIKTIADLKGKKVVMGPPGAGFQMFLEPLLDAHGVKWSDIDVQNAGYGPSVDNLKDGKVDVAFLGGAIPLPALTRAANEIDGLKFVQFDPDARKKLADDLPFFSLMQIPADAYPKMGLTDPFPTLGVGAMHLICRADLTDAEAEKYVSLIWENRKDIGHKGVAKSVNKDNVALETGTPFHPGALKFYKAKGIVHDGDAPKKDTGKTEKTSTKKTEK